MIFSMGINSVLIVAGIEVNMFDDLDKNNNDSNTSLATHR